MGGLARSSVTLGFWDDALDPDLVSNILEREPDVGVAKGGEWVTARGAIKIAPTGAWRLRVERREPGDLEGQIEELFSLVTADLARWSSLPEIKHSRLFCGLFLSEANEGLALSPAVLRKIADRRLSLELDIYAGG